MIDWQRDCVPLLLYLYGYIPFQSVCLCVCLCVCLSPHKSVIFQPIFKCDTWLNASLPGAGSYYNQLMNYTGCFEKIAPKVFIILFLCKFIYDYKIWHINSILQFKSRVQIWRQSVKNSSFGGHFSKDNSNSKITVGEISFTGVIVEFNTESPNAV